MTDDDISTELRTELRSARVPYDEALARHMVDTAMAGGRDLPNLAPLFVPLGLGADPGIARRHRVSRYLVPIAAAATVVAVASVSVVLAAVDHGGAAKHLGTNSAAAPGTHPLTARPSLPGTATPRPPGRTTAPGSQRPVPAAGPLPPSTAVDLTWRFTVHAVPGYDIGRVSITNTVQKADVSLPGQPKSIGFVHIFGAGALDPGKLTSGSALTVNGKPGYFGLFHVPDPYDAASGDQLAEMPTLGWQYAEGAWAVVSGAWGQSSVGESYDLGVARTAEQTIADAVDTAHGAPLRVDFTIGWLPAGLVVENGVNSSTIVGTGTHPETQLGFSDGKQRDRNYPGEYWGSALTISRQKHAADAKDMPKPNITVGGRPGRYDDGGLSVTFPDGTDLVIQVDPLHLGTFTKADLVKIAQNASFVPSPTDPNTWVPASQAVPH